MITGIYAGLAGLILLALSIRVIRARGASKVSLGDGGDDDLMRASRAHGNFTEYVPVALILMLLAELQNAPGIAVHLLGLTLIAGRLCHAYAIPAKSMKMRVAGMIMTFAVLLVGGAGLVVHGLF